MDKKHNSSELRYNIKVRLNAMTREEQTTVRKKVMKDSGMGRSSYYKVLTLKHSDTGDVSAKILLAFSKALKVKMELLFNKKQSTRR
jgi:hypothetical protein